MGIIRQVVGNRPFEIGWFIFYHMPAFLFLDTDEAKMAFGGPEKFPGFRKTGPVCNGATIPPEVQNGLLRKMLFHSGLESS